MTNIYYRELLKKYINLVGEQEGITFINYASEPNFTLNDIAELEKLSDESKKLPKLIDGTKCLAITKSNNQCSKLPFFGSRYCKCHYWTMRKHND